MHHQEQIVLGAYCLVSKMLPLMTYFVWVSSERNLFTLAQYSLQSKIVFGQHYLWNKNTNL